MLQQANVGASQMTTKFLTIRFAKKIQMLLSWNFSGKTAFWDNFPQIFPLHDPLQNANFIYIVVSASLTTRSQLCPSMPPTKPNYPKKTNCPEVCASLFVGGKASQNRGRSSQAEMFPAILQPQEQWLNGAPHEKKMRVSSLLQYPCAHAPL